MHDGSINNMLKCQCSKKAFQHVESKKKKRKRAIEHAISWTAATTLTEGAGIKHPNLQLFDNLLYYLIISAPMPTLQYTWILPRTKKHQEGKGGKINTDPSHSRHNLSQLLPSCSHSRAGRKSRQITREVPLLLIYITTYLNFRSGI